MNKILLILSAACLLSSCYTDFYRTPLRGHEEYAGWEVEPRVYRVGEEGYVKARQVKLRQRRANFYYVLSYGEQWRYHKVSGEMKEQLQQKAYLVTDKELARDLKTTGGAWLPKLPRAAAGKPTPERNCGWQLVGPRTKRAPWYRCALSGLTLVCVDTPVSVAADAAILVTFPLWLPMAYYMSRPVPPPAKSSPQQS